MPNILYFGNCIFSSCFWPVHLSYCSILIIDLGIVYLCSTIRNDDRIFSLLFLQIQGWNEVTMVYDGKNMHGTVQNWRGKQHRKKPLTGNWFGIELGLWCLMSLSTILQLYRRRQFYWWWNHDYRRKPRTWRKSLTNFIIYCCIEYTSPWVWFELKIVYIVVRGNDYTGSCKSNYHTIMATTVT